MALWDMKFKPSLGALRAYARRHGFGALGAGNDEKEKLLAQKAAAERAVSVASRSAEFAKKKAEEAEERAEIAAERAQPDRVLVDMLVGNDPVWKKAVNDIQLKLDEDAKEQFAKFPAVVKRKKAAERKRETAEKRQRKAESKEKQVEVLVRRVEVAEDSLVQIIRDLWKRMYLTGFGSKGFFRTMQWVNVDGTPGSPMAVEAAYHSMRTVSRGFAILTAIGAQLAQRDKSSKPLEAQAVETAFFTYMKDALVFFPSREEQHITVTTLSALVPEPAERLLTLISRKPKLADSRWEEGLDNELNRMQSFWEPLYAQNALVAFVEKYEEARKLEAGLILRNLFPRPTVGLKSPEGYFLELRQWFQSVAWSMLTTLLVGSEGVRRKMKGKTFAEQFIDETAIIDLRIALVGDITAQAPSTHPIWARTATEAQEQQLPYLASKEEREKFKKDGLTLKVQLPMGRVRTFEVEGLEVQYGSFLKIMERAAQGSLSDFVKKLAFLQKELLAQVEFTARGLQRKERSGSGGAVTPKETERAFITESIRVTAPLSTEDETYAELQRVRDERFLEMMETYFNPSGGLKKMSQETLNEHVVQLKALALADPSRRSQTLGRVLRVTAALQNVQAHMANVATNAQARALRANTADLFSERLHLAQRFTGNSSDEDVATQLWRMFASREVSAIYSARSGQTAAERWYDFSKRETTSTDAIRRSWLTQEMQRLGVPVLLGKGALPDLAAEALRYGTTRRLTEEINLCGESNREFAIFEDKGQRSKENPALLESFDFDNGYHRFLYSHYLAQAIEQNIPANAGVARTAMATELWFRIPKLLLAAGQVTGPLRFEKARNLVEADRKAPPEKKLGFELPELREYTKAEKEEMARVEAESPGAGAEFKRALDHKIFMARVTSFNQTMSDRRRLVDRIVLQVNMALALRESTGLIPPELIVPALGPRGINLSTATTLDPSWTLENLLQVEDDYVLILRGLRTFRDTAAQIVAQIPDNAPGAVMLKKYALRAITESMQQLQDYGKQLNARINVVAKEKGRIEEVKSFRESREERFKSEQTKKKLTTGEGK